jgi:hypothetical protein
MVIFDSDTKGKSCDQLTGPWAPTVHIIVHYNCKSQL